MPTDCQDRLPRYFLLADDFGCFLVQPAVIRGRIFPLRPDITDSIVRRDLREFEKAEIVQLYEGQDGKHYGWFPHWLDSQRAPRPTSKPRCPLPPAHFSGHLPQKSAEAGKISPQSQSQSQSSLSFSSQAQDPPIAPQGGLRILPVKGPRKRNRGPTTATEDQQDTRSRALHERAKELIAYLRHTPLAADDRAAWLERKWTGPPEETAAVLAIVEQVEAASRPPGVRNGH